MSQLVEKLNAVGINLESYSVGSYKIKCPRCSHTRKKKEDPCLSVTIFDSDFAAWKCHNFGCTNNGSTKGKNYVIPKKQPDYTPKADKFFSKRGISPEIVRKHNITITKKFIPAVGKEVEALAFPFEKNGQIVNYKYRALHQKAFMQEKDAEKVLYGMNLVPEDATELIICEGECDVMAFNEADIFNVVSVPDGAPSGPLPEGSNKLEYMYNCMEFLGRFKSFVLATDTDEPGEVLAEELCKILPRERCKRCEFIEKDANEELLKQGRGPIQDTVKQAKYVKIDGLESFAENFQEVIDIYEGKDEEYKTYSTGFEKLDSLWKISKGQFVVVTGYPGSGKSEFIEKVCLNLALKEGWKTVFCAFEKTAKDIMASLIPSDVGKPLETQFKDRMSISQLVGSGDKLHKYFNFITSTFDSYVDIDYILSRAAITIDRGECDCLMIDPYNFIERCSDNIDETETLFVSSMLTKVIRFAKDNKVVVFFVAHPRSQGIVNEIQQKAPSLSAISGSQNWYNKADVGISIHREAFDDFTRSPNAMVCVTKIRHSRCGEIGSAVLEFDKRSRRYS